MCVRRISFGSEDNALYPVCTAVVTDNNNTMDFCFTGLVRQRLLQIKLPPKLELLGVAETEPFTDWMPFLLCNQQCQSTEEPP